MVGLGWRREVTVLLLFGSLALACGESKSSNSDGRGGDAGEATGGNAGSSTGTGGTTSSGMGGSGVSGSAGASGGASLGDRMGAVGTRCSVAGDCAVDLDCFGRFFGERSVCTTPCSGSCPDGATCVAGVPDYNSQPTGGYCLRPCQMSPDCAELGSECDSYESGGPRYCF
jgi:hypothetical protein